MDMNQTMAHLGPGGGGVHHLLSTSSLTELMSVLHGRQLSNKGPVVRARSKS